MSRWRIWLAESKRRLRWYLVFTGVVMLIVLFQHRQELRMSQIPFVVAAFALVPLLSLGLDFLTRALDDIVDAGSRRFPALRRASAVLLLPAAAAFGHAAASQWSSQPVRASLAGLCCLGLCWIAAMVALNRTWSGARR